MNFSKMLGNPIVLKSLKKTVCEMAIAIELTVPAIHGHDKPASSQSSANNSHNNNSSHKNNKQKPNAVSDACPHCGLPGFRHGRKPLVNDNIHSQFCSCCCF